MKRDGWVPIRLAWKGSGVGDGEAFVDWCWLGGERFTDPFFDGTIEIAQRTPFNRLFTHRTPIAELGRWYAASPGMAPAGFIFHMSRCGSTLVSRMLAELPENLVISEAGPLDRLARAESIPEAAKAEWLLWMVSALGQRRSGQETRYFIKFDSPTVLALPSIRRAFPSAPWIFLYRNPEEVLVSHLRQPAPAMCPGMITDVPAIEATLEEVVSMSAEEYAARVIGRICECAALGMDECGMLVNYTQLPEAAWGSIARRFGVEFSPDEIARMQAAALYDAKRPRQKFEADGESKRLEVSGAARAAAARWISPHFDELERLRAAAGIP
ncbi:MAG: sulfotransferase family protein [Bryobacteraceae bacterium]|jgi:hypothetical protein